MEELIAELAAAMIGSELGLPTEHLDNHASYLASWLRVLKADSRAILSAAAKAEEASALILRLGSPEAMGSVEQEPAMLEAA
jgi:antirestriction protein ArdC